MANLCFFFFFFNILAPLINLFSKFFCSASGPNFITVEFILRDWNFKLAMLTVLYDGDSQRVRIWTLVKDP